MIPSQLFGGSSGLPGIRTAGTQFEVPPSTIPAGFDCVVQFSRYLLDRALQYNLGQLALDPLSARVTYQPELTSPGLLAAIRPHIRAVDYTQGGIFLEAQLLGPVIESLRSTGSIVTNPTGVLARSTGAPGSAVQTQRTVDISWTLQINLFKATINATTAIASSTTASRTAAPGLGGIRTSVGGVSTGPTGGSAPTGDRVTLAQGTALMHVPTQLIVFGNALEFWLAVNFDGVQPTYESDDPILAEFLKTDYAAGLLVQAIRPLRNASSVALSPTVALAGSLPAVKVAALQLPTLYVHDLILQDDKGQLLSLCASLGNDSSGADSMVRSFLNGSHFAFYISDKVFSPVLAGLWQANAVGTPIVSDVPVEMPVDSNSDQTGTGKARVQVSLSNTLNQSAIQASTDNALGDPLRLVSQQTVQLLALWDPNGKQVDDLGDLATPGVEPLLVRLQMFDAPTGPPPALQPDFQSLLVALLSPLYYPIVEQFPIKDVTGYSSSALRSLTVRWNLQSLLDTITTAVGGALSGS